MTDQQLEKKLKEIFSDQAFVDKLVEMESAEAVRDALQEEGVEYSVEEIEMIREQLIQKSESGDELKKDQLKEVAGGVAVAAVIFGVAAAVGAIAGSARCVDTCTKVHGRRW